MYKNCNYPLRRLSNVVRDDVKCIIPPCPRRRKADFLVTIKEAAHLTRLSRKAIRHYESIGLIETGRNEAGYRLFSADTLSRLRKISYYRDLGFPLGEIKNLLDAPESVVMDAMEHHIAFLEDEIKEKRLAVEAMEAVLSAEREDDSIRKTGLAIIALDLQNDLMAGGSLACNRILKILPPLSDLFIKARAMHVPIIYICDWHKKGDPELLLWNDHMMANTWGAQIIDQVAPEDNDIIIHKNLFNGFTNTKLESTLKSLNSRTLIFTGWRTHVCVAQTAIEAFYKGYRVVIASDGVDSTSQAEHNFGITLMDINYNFEFYPCENILETLLEQTESDLPL